MVWGSQGPLMGLQKARKPQIQQNKPKIGNVRLYLVTLKPQYNDPINNQIPAIKNFISSPFVINSIVKSTSNNETPAMKHKIFHPFRFIKPRFPCITSDGMEQINNNQDYTYMKLKKLVWGPQEPLMGIQKSKKPQNQKNKYQIG